MQRRKNSWLACSLLLLLGGAPLAGMCATDADTLRWEVRLNKYRLLEATVGDDVSCRVPILRHSDTLWVQFASNDSVKVKEVLELLDSHSAPLLHVVTAAPLSVPIGLPAMAIFAKCTFVQGNYELRYQNSQGRRVLLARLYIVGTD